MATTRWLSMVVVVVVALAACGGDDRGERDGGADASRPRDGGMRVDAPGVDGSCACDGGSQDAGPSGIVIDGIIGASEWVLAAEASNDVASGWGDNTLTRVYAFAFGGSLYLAVEGHLEAGAENAILVYVDNERGSGVGVEDPIALSDGTGALDNALSAGITTPADVDVDFAWGTRDFDRAASGDDDRIGWRDIATNPGDFGWIAPADAPTSCGASACETRIALATLGGSATGAIALFARLGNTDGMSLSNQCVPEDDPAMPGTVSMVLDVSR